MLRVEDGATEHNNGGNNITAATVISDLVLVQAQQASVRGVPMARSSCGTMVSPLAARVRRRSCELTHKSMSAYPLCAYIHKSVYNMTVVHAAGVLQQTILTAHTSLPLIGRDRPPSLQRALTGYISADPMPSRCQSLCWCLEATMTHTLSSCCTYPSC